VAKSSKSPKASRGKGRSPPDPSDFGPFLNWLAEQPREWSVTLAARAAVRALPLLQGTDNVRIVVLSTFRASAIAWFAAKYPNRAIEVAAAGAAIAAARACADATAAKEAAPAFTASAAAAAAAYAGAAVDDAAAAYARVVSAVIKHDAERLHERMLTPEQLADDRLWPICAPAEIADAWQRLSVSSARSGRGAPRSDRESERPRQPAQRQRARLQGVARSGGRSHR
jgi:hypothetical protein